VTITDEAQRMVRVGVQLQPQRAAFAALREATVRLDASGLDTLFTSDHFFTVPGDPDGAIFECWTTLASLAEVTEQVELGPLVGCTAYRNANLLADLARTVDHISGGRLILGVGAGWYEPDYLGYGFSFGSVGDRLDAFEEALSVIEDRMSRLNPPPVHGRIPLLIGGGGERRMLRLVAAKADIWNVIADPQVVENKSRILDDWCARVGRPPAEIERSVLITTDQLERCDEYLAAGATHLILDLGSPPWPLELAGELVRWRDQQNGVVRSTRPQLLRAIGDLGRVDVADTEMALRFEP